MKNKTITKKVLSLKTDIHDRLFQKFKVVRSLKAIKVDSFVAFRKKKRNLVKKKRDFIVRLNLFSKKNKFGTLNFKTKNSRNAFLRTKRKSSYGQTLLEKQKLKFHVPNLTNKKIKKLYILNGKNFLTAIAHSPVQVVNRTNLFVSSVVVSKKHLLKEFPVLNNVKTIDLVLDNNHHNFPILVYTKLASPQISFLRKTIIFDRPIDKNYLLDMRLFKVMSIISDQPSYPFRLEHKKVLQHYRLKRN